MNKSIIATLIALTSATAFVSNAEEAVNYGDPTASFTTLGVSASNDNIQLNSMMGVGSNIYQLDIGRHNDSGDYNYRGRFFHVTEGLGYSADIIGDKDTTTGLAGIIYKMQLTDNISVFPMASVGYTSTKKDDIETADIGTNANDDTSLGQAGIYAMYGFDAGHWVYVNPKTTYKVEQKEFINQIEVGAGFMVADNISVGTKVEFTAKNAELGMKEDTVAWVQANIYF